MNKKKEKMGFLRINTLKSALLTIFAALVVVVITVNITNSSNNNETNVNKTNSEAVVHLNDANFQETIKEGVTLVDFWAVWCAPCRIQGPIVENVAKEMGNKATVAKLDVDKNKATSAQYGIRNIPTLIIFKEGKVVQTLVGLKTKEALVQAINKHL